MTEISLKRLTELSTTTYQTDKRTISTSDDDDTTKQLKATVDDAYRRKERFWKITVIIICFISYAFNYFVRNHIYVTTDLFKNYIDPNDSNNAQQWLSIMYSFGTVGFAISKILVSVFIDTKLNSGVLPFAFGLITAPLVSIALAVIDISNITFRIIIIIILWFCLQICLAPIWSGVIKIISKWMNYYEYGRVMSVMSLSFLAGDAFTRFIYAYALTLPIFHNNWRSVFIFGAIMTFIAVIPLLLFVKDSPTQRGLNGPIENPENVYSKSHIQPKYDIIESESEVNNNLCAILKPLFMDRMFYFTLLFNMQLIYLRGYFQMYAASYLSSIGASNSNASLISGLFPLIGILSAPIHGIWYDKMLKNKRFVLRYCMFLINAIIILFAMIMFYFEEEMQLVYAALLLLIAGYGILGSYPMIYVLSMDIGGHTSPAIVSGIADCVGLSGQLIMTLLSGYGDYHFMFGTLVIVSISFLIACVMLVIHKCYRARYVMNDDV